jgi:hypothetical protein
MKADTEEQAQAAWTRWREARHRWWTRQAVGEAVSEAPVVDPTVVGDAMAVQAWRRLRSGHASGGEIIVARVRV